MESLYDNTKKSRLTNTTKENDRFKQQLVNFLVDRINYYGIFTTTSKALQEVLAFVNKGGKE